MPKLIPKSSPEYQLAVQDSIEILTQSMIVMDSQLCNLEAYAESETEYARIRFGIDLLGGLIKVIREVLEVKSIPQADGES